jgi:hypothetical protein
MTAVMTADPTTGPECAGGCDELPAAYRRGLVESSPATYGHLADR